MGDLIAWIFLRSNKMKQRSNIAGTLPFVATDFVTAGCTERERERERERENSGIHRENGPRRYIIPIITLIPGSICRINESVNKLWGNAPEGNAP